MEKSRTTAMIEATFSWSDIGSWDEAAKLFGGSERGQDSGDKGGQSEECRTDEETGSQTALPQVISVDSSNIFVDSDLPVALAGVEDLVVVIKNGAVLVCKRGESQKVKQVVEKIRESGEEELL
jgi:mannose-1-phosphate guanylyltransferase/mannose-1-phosphate guanylyltransferase/mannose-6-phosphate isomerase